MTDWFLFAGDVPPAVSIVDEGSQYTLGMEWAVTAPGLYLKGYRFHRAADLAVTGPITARSWDAATEVAVADTDAAFVLAGGGWQEALLPVPVAVPQGVRWRVGAHFPNGRYSATPDYWTTGPGAANVSNGPLTAYSLAAASENEQGSFTVGAALAFPDTGSPNGSNYWITPIITDTVEDAREGTASAPVEVAVQQVGVKAAASVLSLPMAMAVTPTSGSKAAAGVVGIPVGVNVAAVGGQSTVGPAPVSTVLCSPWATAADVPQSVKTELNLPNASQWAAPLLRASELLWALSGRRWYGSGCQETAVLRSDNATWPWDQTWGSCDCWTFPPDTWPPVGVEGSRHILQPVALSLPRAEGITVNSVHIDGVLLSANAYRVSASGWLERIDGGSWPVCEGTTVVAYQHGRPPPAGGRDAAVTLAIELAKDLYGIAGCRLPRRVRSITRQGVSMELVDPAEFLDKGLVGLVSVDMWIRAVNPDAQAQEGYVWSPDLPASGMRTP